MTDRELMQQALSVLCNNVYPRNGVRDNRHLTPKSNAEIYQQTVDALFDRLAQPKQEWVGLTYQEVVEIMGSRDWTTCWSDVTYTRAVEAKLKEKNA